MSLSKEILKHYSDVSEDESQLTRYDGDIVHCRLDTPTIAESPYFVTTSNRDIDNAVDSIYCSANAGLEIGKALLHTAALLQYSDMDSAVRDAEKNLGEATTVVPEPIEDIHDTLSLLDLSFAAIEVAIEDAKNAARPQGS